MAISAKSFCPTPDQEQVKDPHNGADGGPVVVTSVKDKPPRRLGNADKLPYPPKAPGEPTSKAGKSIV